MRLHIHSAKQLVAVCQNQEPFLRKSDLKQFVVWNQDAADEQTKAGVSVVVDDEGKIADLGWTSRLTTKWSTTDFKRTIDASGCVVMPGLIDGHTHPVWAGDRVHEFEMKLAGATYLEVHKAGGGIQFTVTKTKEASEAELLESLKDRFRQMSKAGTTTVETKSGYGLELEPELKLLRILTHAKRECKGFIETSITYCGAHSVPKGKTAEEATKEIVETDIPFIAGEIYAARLDVDNIDVFCENGVFDLEQTKKILQAGIKHEMKVNFHGDELNFMGSGELAGELNAQTVSHLEEVSDAGVAAMATAGCVAVVLPTTAYILRLRTDHIRKLLDGDVPVALGTDFNPNAHCLSMPMTMHLACVLGRMTMEEALVASTINAAASIGRSKSHGSLEIGKQADMLVLEVVSWQHLIYQFGGHDKVIKQVIKDGCLMSDLQ